MNVAVYMDVHMDAHMDVRMDMQMDVDRHAHGRALGPHGHAKTDV